MLPMERSWHTVRPGRLLSDRIRQYRRAETLGVHPTDPVRHRRSPARRWTAERRLELYSDGKGNCGGYRSCHYCPSRGEESRGEH